MTTMNPYSLPATTHSYLARAAESLSEAMTATDVPTRYACARTRSTIAITTEADRRKHAATGAACRLQACGRDDAGSSFTATAAGPAGNGHAALQHASCRQGG